MTIERTIAVCVFRNDTRILVALGYDEVAEEYFFRPLGGQVEPGESPEATVVRELHEETGLAVSRLRPLGVIDNRFEYRGEPHRETVHVFDGEFVDPFVYKQAFIPIDEPVWEGPARWIDLGQLQEYPVYPEGLLLLLANERAG